MPGLIRRPSDALLVIAFVTLACATAHAQSSLGIGSNEATIPESGLFQSFFAWINTQQREFYRAMTTALRAMKDNPWAGVVTLAGLSFAYGVFHAAGPGHGKAVISSYVIANEVALRRGIALSFVSAFLQALTALVVVGAAYLILRGTAVSMTDTQRFLEVASYIAVTAFGAWLLWSKLRKAGWLRMPSLGGPALAVAGGPAVQLDTVHGHAGHHRRDHSHPHEHPHGHHHGHGHGHDAGCGCGHDHAHAHEHRHGPEHKHVHHLHGSAPAVAAGAHAHHVHADGENCAECGHAHMPDPRALTGPFDRRAAWSAVMAVGMRPCSGAVIVLTFALLNGLWLGGVASVLAMALGTAITVSALATLAVVAKNRALRLYGDGAGAARLLSGIEVFGAALVLVFGLLLLSASLQA